MSHSSSRFPNQRWQIAPPQPDQAAQLAQATDLPPLLAQVLINRGLDTPEAAQTFLEPELQSLPSPLDDFPDLPIALDLLLRAISTHRPIAICGDYDADGMTSTALLLRALRYLGAIVDYAIPSRMQEGYGINQRIVEEFYQDGVSLILTVDNGIAAHEPIARARELGLTVIVTDHHDIPETLPKANAILNPKLIRADSPYRSVAGVGVAYILAICLAQCLQKTPDLTTPLIELFTLGTIADLAPLTGVNRRWVRRGLKLLPKSRIPGVQALIQVAGLSHEKALKPEAIGFRLGPRINAIGRISDPQIVIELLTTDDDGQALELAIKCEQVNQLRQRLCELIEQEAIAWCEQEWQRDRVLVIVRPEWHHGVIGIVASRLVERYGVPVFIGTYEDEDQQLVRGSARGIPEFHVFEALQACSDLLEKFGGHRAAGGFSLKAEHLEGLRSRLSFYANQHLQPQHLKPLVAIDAEANFQQLTLELYEQIDQLHPCGIENPDPVFWTPNVQIIGQQPIGRDQAHLKLTLAQAERPTIGIRALAWRWGDYYPLPSPIDVAYRLRLNEWNGTRSVELEVVGVRLVEPEKVSENISPLIHKNDSIEQKLNGSIDRPAASPHRQADSSQPSFWEAAAPLPAQPATTSDAEDSQLLVRRIEFYYNTRKYTCSVLQAEAFRELRIRNHEGQVLAVQPQQRRGFLGKRRETAREIDISQPHYFNLIRAALDALEIAEKTQLLQEKDALIAERDQQITALSQQLDRLKQALQQTTPAALNQPAVSQAAVAVEEVSPAAVAPLPAAVLPKPDDIKRQLKHQLGELVWHRLSPQSQKDLVAAYRALHAIEAEVFTAQMVDYSEVGLKLGFVAEREIVQPFFKQLYGFVQAGVQTGVVQAIGGIVLKARKKYTLTMLPPLLATEWQSWNDDALTSDQPHPEPLRYRPIAASAISPEDRQTIRVFLQQWPHPLAIWLQQPQAASAIAQIDALKTLATQPENSLHQWQFDWLRSRLLGDAGQGGILREMYGNERGDERVKDEG